MNLIQLAGSLARRADFQAYAASVLSEIGGEELPPVSTDEAAEFIRIICQVDSRRDLASNPEAAHRFEIHVRRPFVRWAEQQELNLRRAA